MKKKNMSKIKIHYRDFTISKIKDLIKDDSFLDYFIEDIEEEGGSLTDEEINSLNNFQQSFLIEVLHAYIPH